MKKTFDNKYRPTTLDGYVFQNPEIERTVRKWVAEKSIPNIMMVSNAGQGKTTLSRILVNELEVDDTDLLRVNASTENGMAFIRDRLEPWLRNASFNGDMKVVQLEEFDKLTPAAQDALRDIIESNIDTTRFICTANNRSKLTPAMISRFEGGILNMDGMDEDGVIDLVERVIEGESITFDDEDVVFQHIEKHMPDVRKILLSIQKSLDENNKLYPPVDSVSSVGDLEAWGDLWASDGAMSESDLEEALELTELVDNENYDYFYNTMYENHHKLPDPQTGIVKIADYLYKASTVAANQRLMLDACLYHIFAVEE